MKKFSIFCWLIVILLFIFACTSGIDPDAPDGEYTLKVCYNDIDKCDTLIFIGKYPILSDEGCLKTQRDGVVQSYNVACHVRSFQVLNFDESIKLKQ